MSEIRLLAEKFGKANEMTARLDDRTQKWLCSWFISGRFVDNIIFDISIGTG